LFLDKPGRREAAAGYSLSRFFRRLAPFPFAGVPIVSRVAALDHFVAPAVAYDDESGQVTTAEADLGLKVGDWAIVVIKASDVMIGVE
jgi:hypothetical protein